MEPNELDIALEELEQRLERLRSLYEQYFLGIEKVEPTIARKDVDRRIWILRREQIRNTAKRFRLQVMIQRYNTFQQYWMRTCREIENGTYKRHVRRAEQRFGKPALTIAARRRHRGTERESVGTPSSVPPDSGGARGAGPLDEIDRAFDFLAFGEAPNGSPATDPVRPGVPVPLAVRPADRHPTPSLPDAPSSKRTAPAAAAHPQKPPPRLPLPGKPAALPPIPPRRGLAQSGVVTRGEDPLKSGIVTPPPAPRDRTISSGPPPLPKPPQVRAPGIPSQAEVAAKLEQARAAAKSSRPPTRAPSPTAGKSATEAPRPRTPARPPIPARPSPRIPDALAANGLSEQRIRELHAELSAKKHQLRDPSAVSLDGLAKSLRSTEAKLQGEHAGKKVDFRVVIKDGKAVVKPILR